MEDICFAFGVGGGNEDICWKRGWDGFLFRAGVSTRVLSKTERKACLMAPRSFVFISRQADDEGEHGVDGYPKGESTFATYIVYVGED